MVIQEYGVWAPSPEVDLKSSHLLAGDSHRLCATSAPADLAVRTPLWTRGFVARLVFTVLLWWHAESFLCQRHEPMRAKALCRQRLLFFMFSDLRRCCFQQWGLASVCGEQPTPSETVWVVWDPFSDVTHSWYWKLHLVIRDIQFGFFYPVVYLIISFRRPSYICISYKPTMLVFILPLKCL